LFGFGIRKKKGQRMRLHKQYEQGFFSILLLLGLALWQGGCKDSSDAKTQRVVASESLESGQMVVSSDQMTLISQSEYNAIKEQALTSDGTLSPGELENLAKQLVNRMEAQISDESMNNLDAYLEALKTAKSTEEIKQINDAIMKVCRDLADQRETIRTQISQANSERLNQAQEKLTAAIAEGQQSERREILVGPQFILGTLHLLGARDQYLQMQQMNLEIQVMQNRVPLFLSGLSQQQTILSTADNYLPDKTIQALQRLLEGGDGKTGYVQELKEAEAQVGQLQREQEQLRADLRKNRDLAAALYQQYLVKMEEADRLKGTPRYAMQEQAYYLRAGSETQKGSLYYEKEGDLIESRLKNVEVKLAASQQRYRYLQEMAVKIQEQMQGLQQAGTYEAVVKMKAEAQSHREALLGDLTTFWKGNVQDAYTRYHELRVSAVERYQASQKAFDEAGRADNSVRNFSKRMIEIIDGELLELWNYDGNHYDVQASVIHLLENVPEISADATQWRRDAEKLAEQARVSAAKLTKEEVKEEEQPEPENPQPEDLPPDNIPPVNPQPDMPMESAEN